MKILIHSNAPWSCTGYGTQTALFADRFTRAGHEVAISANWGIMGAGIEWPSPEGNVFRVYPADNAWGNRTLPAVCAHFGDGEPRSVLLLTLLDVYVLTSERLADLNMASWCPVDHEPLPPRVRQFFDRTHATPVAMSRFGERMLSDAGFEPVYVPHGIDTSVFQPFANRQEIREAMGLKDRFVVGMVARNQGNAPPRKGFPQMFEAFAEFHRRHDDTVLYLHAEVTGCDQGLNLVAAADACGIPKSAIGTSDQFMLELGVPPEDMAIRYNAFDVLANPSLGEGFGIPIVEAQACGTPVIVTDWTSMPELCGAGWKIDGDRFYDCAHGAHYKIPSVAYLVEALEQAYQHAGGMRDAARAFALKYDADHVMDAYWAPALADLEQRMNTGREVAPLQLAGAAR